MTAYQQLLPRLPAQQENWLIIGVVRFHRLPAGNAAQTRAAGRGAEQLRHWLPTQPGYTPITSIKYRSVATLLTVEVTSPFPMS
jgi:hypothetical protein